MKRIVFSTLLCGVLLYAQSVDDDLAGFDDTPTKIAEISTDDEIMDGFDDTPTKTVQTSTDNELMDDFDDTPIEADQNLSSSSSTNEAKKPFIAGLTGELTQQIAYSWDGDAPHDGINSFKSSLFLDFEHKFENDVKIKINAKAYYDSIYSIKGRDDYSSQELDELESEIELFDAYIEGSITDNLDMKIGRQVVVWGRSDTLRVTDILNPLDNRRPGMVDIEDLRLPVAMAKFDYFIGDWRVTPIAILEQRFSKNPPFGSAFYPVPFETPEDEDYSDVTYALSVGGEFSGWDVNFYAARVHDDEGHIEFVPTPSKQHDKVNMFGTALNVLTGPWLFKTEIAYFDGLKYSTTEDKSFERIDVLLGVEYNGIADTLISYDVVTRNLSEHDDRLLNELNPLNKHSYQHAFRVSSDFMNATMTANYLISLYGEKLDEGGFQRAWVKYELGEGINTNFGIVDYIGGGIGFNAIKDNDMVFSDISYNF